MSFTPSRSPLLPPYAVPLAGEAESARAVGVSARKPFVPPTHAPRNAVSSATVGEFGKEIASVYETDVTEASAAPPGESDAPQSDAENGESLPWIEAFAEDDMNGGEPAAQTPTDTWAIEDATVSISHLAQDLTAASGITPPLPQVDVHAPWAEDEAWMDIMPALPNSGSTDSAMDTSWARAFAEPPAPMVPPPLPSALPSGDAQAAAASLEAVARRLRAGELRVPGFHAEAGDAAALAATLASLLGAHE